MSGSGTGIQGRIAKTRCPQEVWEPKLPFQFCLLEEENTEDAPYRTFLTPFIKSSKYVVNVVTPPNATFSMILKLIMVHSA